MFRRIMGVVLAVIIVLASGLCVLSMWALRNQQVNARLEALTSDAREIAYLASRNSISTAALMFGFDDLSQEYLEWKADEVYQQYGAYIAVVDRRGRLMDNFAVASNDPTFAASLNGKALREALMQVLGGEEVSLRVILGGDAIFTVGVPFVQNDQVLGAVLIHTKAQSVEGGLGTVLWQIVLVVLAVTGFAGVMLSLYVRSVLTPLKELTRASKTMADGDYHVRVSTDHPIEDVREVASAFNSMAGQVELLDASRREFVANVSHELRSPITSIGGFVEGMLDGTIPESERNTYLQVVDSETKRLSKLIEKLLALSRLERDDASLDLTDFDMCELMRRCLLRRAGDLDSKHMEVAFDFALDPCMVHADSERMEQVIVNLLDNAIKFTGEGGKITLETREAGEKREIIVRDTGIGIPAEDRDRIFERFFTSDRAHTSGKGTGLGLSICQRIMQMHGESIRLLDTEEGTAFALTLPRPHEEDQAV